MHQYLSDAEVVASVRVPPHAASVVLTLPGAPLYSLSEPQAFDLSAELHSGAMAVQLEREAVAFGISERPVLRAPFASPRRRQDSGRRAQAAGAHGDLRPDGRR